MRRWLLLSLLALGCAAEEPPAPAEEREIPRDRRDAGRLFDAGGVDAERPRPDQGAPMDQALRPDQGAPDMTADRDQAPAPDMGRLGPDLGQPDPDMARPDPDMARPDPDMARPDPDMAPPDPDMAPPAPDMAPPDPDMAPPEPDMAPPDPDMAPPEPATPLAGTWRWTVEQPFAEPVRFDSLVAIQTAADGRMAGLSIDRYGVATLRGTVQPDGTFQAQKTYAVGPSAPEPGEDPTVFRYAARLQAGAPVRAVDGEWGLTDQPPVADWAGARAPDFDPAALGGAWVIEADFADGDAVFIVSPFGQIGGTISDRVGEATIDGVYDPVTGAVWFRKAYEGQDLDWWYRGRLEGGRIVAGEYMAEADELLPDEVPGVWTARRP